MQKKDKLNISCVAITTKFRPPSDGGELPTGRRQSIPSHNMESCARVSDTAPLAACGHTKRHGPAASETGKDRRHRAPNNFTRSPLRPRKIKTWPVRGFCSSSVLHHRAQPGKPAAHVGHSGHDPDVGVGRKESSSQAIPHARTNDGSARPSTLTGARPETRCESGHVAVGGSSFFLSSATSEASSTTATGNSRASSGSAPRRSTPAANRADIACAKQTPGWRSRHAAALLSPLTHPTTTSLPRSGASLLHYDTAACCCSVKRFLPLMHPHSLASHGLAPRHKISLPDPCTYHVQTAISPRLPLNGRKTFCSFGVFLGSRELERARGTSVAGQFHVIVSSLFQRKTALFRTGKAGAFIRQAFADFLANDWDRAVVRSGLLPNTTPTSRRFLSIPQFARQTGIHVGTARRWLREKENRRPGFEAGVWNISRGGCPGHKYWTSGPRPNIHSVRSRKDRGAIEERAYRVEEAWYLRGKTSYRPQPRIPRTRSRSVSESATPDS